MKLVTSPPGAFYFQKDKGKGIRLALLNKLMETLNLMMLITQPPEAVVEEDEPAQDHFEANIPLYSYKLRMII